MSEQQLLTSPLSQLNLQDGGRVSGPPLVGDLVVYIYYPIPVCR